VLIVTNCFIATYKYSYLLTYLGSLFIQVGLHFFITVPLRHDLFSNMD